MKHRPCATTFTAPDQLGDYTLRVTNPAANVLESAAPPLTTAAGQSVWLTRRIGVRPGVTLTVIVEPQSPIPATTTWGVVAMLLSLVTVGSLILRHRGGDCFAAP